MPAAAMKHEQDPKDVILASAGDLSKIEVGENQILFAIYLRPERTVGGIILTPKNLEEDLHQGKVGLVLKMGKQTEGSVIVRVNDWIVVRPADAWSLDVNQVPCRMVHARFIKGKVPNPDMIW